MAHVILTAIGPDRPGLVDDASRFIFDRSGNIEDSRMVNLRGQFAMMLLASGDEAMMERLGRDLPSLSKQTSLRVELHAAAPLEGMSANFSAPFRLRATAIDQPGLVHRVSHLLRDHHVNIESLETRLRPAPYTGAPMFDMEMILAVPHTTAISHLRQNVSKLCDELNVDATLEPV